jgi:hypothetical protein
MTKNMDPNAEQFLTIAKISHVPSRMVSSGLLRRVALIRTEVSEEPGASFIRVPKISELGTTQAATSNRRTLRRNTNQYVGSYKSHTA